MGQPHLTWPIGEGWKKGRLRPEGWCGARNVTEKVLPSRAGFGDANVLSVDHKPTGHSSDTGRTGSNHVLVINKCMGTQYLSLYCLPPQTQRFGTCISTVFIIFISDKTKSQGRDRHIAPYSPFSKKLPQKCEVTMWGLKC